MAESPRPADVRLTIPIHDPYLELAAELVAKFAEYAGAKADAAKPLAASVLALALKLGNGRAKAGVPETENVVTLTLEADDDRLRVTAAAGDRREHADFSF